VYSPSGAKIAVVQQAQPGGPLVKGTVSLPGGDTAIYNFSGLSYLRHTDWLGSSRLATTWNHGVYSKESYAPFGETYNEQANTSGGPDRSFTGQDQDVVTGSQGTGIYEFMFRKYDPAAGRWLSPDPMGWGSASLENPQSLNRYAYVMNSPLSNVDPNGLECVWDDGSYDSNNDPETGAVDANGQHSNCTSAGGTWVDHSNFDGMPDWCSDQDADAGTCGYDTSLPNALFDPNAPSNDPTKGMSLTQFAKTAWQAWTSDWTAPKATCQQLNKYAADLQNMGIGGAIGGAKAGVWGSIEGAIPAISGNLISRWTATHCD
jgi:RHS repeat-associated protein